MSFRSPNARGSLGRAAGDYWLVRDVDGGFTRVTQQLVASVAGVDDTLDGFAALARPCQSLSSSLPSDSKADGEGLIAIATPVMAIVKDERRTHSGEIGNILV
jgi:hypothetical protein